MAWLTLPLWVSDSPLRGANYRLSTTPNPPQSGFALAELAGGAFSPAGLAELIGPYAGLFAYGPGSAGHDAALLEGLTRIESCSAALEAKIAPLWQDLARVPLTVAEDENKQRVDRLFGLDGEAGLLGALKRHRHAAATDLPAMSGAAQADFLAALTAFSVRLLPGSAGVDLWAWRSMRTVLGGARPVLRAAQPAAALALPVYLQTLALIVLLRGWIGGLPGHAEKAAIMRHRAFLTGAAVDAEWPLAACYLDGENGAATAAVSAAAAALTP